MFHRTVSTSRTSARLEGVALEARFTPAAVDAVPTAMVMPEIVVVAPTTQFAPASAATLIAPTASANVRSDLFGSSDAHANETDEIWNDWCSDDMFDAKRVAPVKAPETKTESIYFSETTEQTSTDTVERSAPDVSAGGEG